MHIISKMQQLSPTPSLLTHNSLVVHVVKNPPTVHETGFDSWVRKIPCRMEWLPTPVFLPREFHGQRCLAGYSPWGCKVLDTTE